MYRIRHTMLHAVRGDWRQVPAHGFWRFTEPSLRPDDAFIKRGGLVLQTRTREVAPIPRGDATITAGGALSFPFVVHLAALEGGRVPSRETLVSAVRDALSLSHHQSLRTVLIPMPNLLQGISPDEFARTVAETISGHLHEQISKLERCILLGADETEYGGWHQAVNAQRELLSLPPLETAGT
ncbi:MAG: hypothetical protein KatS3mg019_0274 [Fimbriimonadales bacterium]|nr:MAG: hypothetical protein KatS3mg019_0274 [Fimbriimonadales bacterium]